MDYTTRPTEPAPTPRMVKHNVLVRRDPAREKVGSGILYAPQGSEDWPLLGTVVATGPLCQGLSVGDRVMFLSKAGSALNQDERELENYPEWERLVVLGNDPDDPESQDIVGVVSEE